MAQDKRAHHADGAVASWESSSATMGGIGVGVTGCPGAGVVAGVSKLAI